LRDCAKFGGDVVWRYREFHDAIGAFGDNIGGIEYREHDGILEWLGYAEWFVGDGLFPICDDKPDDLQRFVWVTCAGERRDGAGIRCVTCGVSGIHHGFVCGNDVLLLRNIVQYRGDRIRCGVVVYDAGRTDSGHASGDEYHALWGDAEWNGESERKYGIRVLPLQHDGSGNMQ
jgi:hypothetical protein